MSAETEFAEGLIVKPPRDGSPDYVKAKLSIKREEMIAWLQGREGEWVNLEVKEARSGKWYAAVDTWKPEAKTSPAPRAAAKAAPARATATATEPDDDIPF